MQIWYIDKHFAWKPHNVHLRDIGR